MQMLSRISISWTPTPNYSCRMIYTEGTGPPSALTSTVPLAKSSELVAVLGSGDVSSYQCKENDVEGPSTFFFHEDAPDDTP